MVSLYILFAALFLHMYELKFYLHIPEGIPICIYSAGLKSVFSFWAVSLFDLGY